MGTLREIIRKELLTLYEERKEKRSIFNDYDTLLNYTARVEDRKNELERFYTEVETVVYRDFNPDNPIEATLPEEKLMKVDKILKKYL